ncbi:hypothetical protein BGX31_001882 [Mortierella sp. GBA43]|nr:hypothetical protein BGX31_001882 [Mortierella sp. GBA43]
MDVSLQDTNKWTIVGTLDTTTPFECTAFYQVNVTMIQPEDFNGKFTGWMYNDQLFLVWENFASITGTVDPSAPECHFDIKGTSLVRFYD